MKKNVNDFVSLLVAETLELTNESSVEKSNVVDLNKYFESKSTNKDNLELNTTLLKYLSEKKCYSLKFNNSTYEFPENWDLFANVQNNSFNSIELKGSEFGKILFNITGQELKEIELCEDNYVKIYSIPIPVTGLVA